MFPWSDKKNIMYEVFSKCGSNSHYFIGWESNVGVAGLNFLGRKKVLITSTSMKVLEKINWLIKTTCCLSYSHLYFHTSPPRLLQCQVTLFYECIHQSFQITHHYLFDLINSLCPSQHFFRHVGTGLHSKQELMCLDERHNAVLAGEARTPYPSILSQALYHLVRIFWRFSGFSLFWYLPLPSFLWRFSGFSLFWYLPLPYQNMEKLLKLQRRLILSTTESLRSRILHY